MRLFAVIFLVFSLLVCTLAVVDKKPSRRKLDEKVKTTTELSNLQIQVASPNGAGFVHSALPIQARALGARLQGGKSKPTIGDDVLIPFDDPNFE